MSSADHTLSSETIGSVQDFNAGSFDQATKAFAPDVAFTVPGRSALAGTYRGREGVADFFRRMQELSGGSLTVTPDEVLASDEHVVLFLRFQAEREGEKADFTIAGFHMDRTPDGFRRATFLPDDLNAFDRLFAPA
jgi:ketosteroid isomerase-like protein